MKENLFSKFEDSKTESLHHCKGGAIVQTGDISNSGTLETRDFQEVTMTQVAGQPEGSTQMDYGQEISQASIVANIWGVIGVPI